jgi:hypothetical protein
MMRTVLRTAATVLIVVVTVSAQTDSTNGQFSELTLTTQIVKERFVELEPIPLTLLLRNNTPKPIAGHTALGPQGYLDVIVYTSHGKAIKAELSRVRSYTVISPRTIMPQESHRSRQLLRLDLDKVFPKPGRYEIEAVLHDIDWKEEIKAQPITISIEPPPTDDDRAALDYIRLHGGGDVFFNGRNTPARSLPDTLLRAWLDKFGETRYGVYVHFALGEWYFSREDYESAMREFDRSANDEEFIFADKSLSYLSQCAMKLGALDRAANYRSVLQQKYPDSEYLR